MTTKGRIAGRAISAIAGFAIAVGAFIPSMAYAADDTNCEVGTSTIAECFHDATVAKLVATNAALGGDTSKVFTQTVADAVHNLLLSNTDAENLEGVQYLQNLTLLKIDDTKITDISPLSNLPKLSQIYLDNDPIADFSPLTTLPALTNLSATNTGMSDLSVISSISTLNNLIVDSNNITSIEPIAKLTNLQYFRAWHNQISDLSPLAKTSVISIGLVDNNISDVSPLSTLANLQYLDLSNNHIIDITPIPESPTLQVAYVYNGTATLDDATSYIGEDYVIKLPQGFGNKVSTAKTLKIDGAAADPANYTYDATAGTITLHNLALGAHTVTYKVAGDNDNPDDPVAPYWHQYDVVITQTVNVVEKPVTPPTDNNSGNNSGSTSGSAAGSSSSKGSSNTTGTSTKTAKVGATNTNPAAKLATTGSNVSVAFIAAAIATILGAAALALNRVRTKH